MSFSSYGFIKQINDLHKRKVYKEKLRKIYGVEYSSSRPDKQLKKISPEDVKKTLLELQNSRTLKRRRSLFKNFLILLCSLFILSLIVSLIDGIIRLYL